MNKSQPTYVIYLDLKKAFDSVSHTTLSKKLIEIGLPEKSRNWFNSYLANWCQRVNLDGNLSTYRDIQYGVPQGSVLGPILFSIYINTLPRVIDVDLHMFADDTVLFATDPLVLQENLSITYDWCCINTLTLNPKKTQWMVFGLDNVDNGVSFKIGGEILERVDCYKYLGLYVGNRQTFHDHRTKLIQQLNLKLNYFAKIRKFHTTKTALTMYKATMLPLLDYADLVYEQNFKYVNKQLQKIQNRALRLIYNQHLIEYDNRLSTYVLHENAKMCRLKYRRGKHLLIHAYDLASKPDNLDRRQLPTRAHEGKRLSIPKIGNKKFYRSIYYRAADSWNKLIPSMTLIDSRPEFKRLLDGVAAIIGGKKEEKSKGIEKSRNCTCTW